jgi:uncharacterized membrane protein YoaT (DUF817 family)
MPILFPLCLLNTILHSLAIMLRVYRVQIRGYLPPAKFYSRLVRTLLYFLFIHIMIGCYMYGNVLNCS